MAPSRARIRSGRLLVALLVASGVLVWTPAGSAARASRASGSAVGRPTLVDVSWPSPQVGWALATHPCPPGTCPVLMRTRDGGRTWRAASTPPTAVAPACLISSASCVSQIRFASARVGYLVGPALWLTTDGGRSWQRVRGPYTETLGVVGTSVDRVAYHQVGCPGPCAPTLQVAALGSRRWRTVDRRLLPPDRSSTAQIVATRGASVLALFGSQAGPVSAHAAVVVIGRGTWRNTTDPCARYDAATRREQDLVSLAADARTVVGLCTPHDQSGGAFVVASRDGARTWVRSTEVAGRGVFGAVAVASPTTMVVATPLTFVGSSEYRARLVASFDAGRRWRVVVTIMTSVGTDPQIPSAVGFSSARDGWWLAGPHALELTRDGGHTWMRAGAFPRLG